MNLLCSSDFEWNYNLITILIYCIAAYLTENNKYVNSYTIAN
jgi:hypothetical protein